MLPATSEWLVIFGVALLMFGPTKLPKLAEALGQSVRNFKKGIKTEEEPAQTVQQDLPKPK